MTSSLPKDGPLGHQQFLDANTLSHNVQSVFNPQIGEDEFFDAVENALDKLQEEQDYRDKMKLMSLSTQQDVHHQMQSEATQHQLWPTIDKVSQGPTIKTTLYFPTGTLKCPSTRRSRQLPGFFCVFCP